MSVVMMGNNTPISSCMYSPNYSQKIVQNSSWIIEEQLSHITAPFQADVIMQQENKFTKDDLIEESKSTKPLRENNRKSRGYKHVPHKDKPAQVVARRNARERRRVQAVNTAFIRLRKAIPIENTRGKRISKVKTLQYAIDYIHNLEELLELDMMSHQPFHIISQYYIPNNEDFFDGFQFEDEI